MLALSALVHTVGYDTGYALRTLLFQQLPTSGCRFSTMTGLTTKRRRAVVHRRGH